MMRTSPGIAALYAPRAPRVTPRNNGVRPQCSALLRRSRAARLGQRGVGELLDQERRLARGVLGARRRPSSPARPRAAGAPPARPRRRARAARGRRRPPRSRAPSRRGCAVGSRRRSRISSLARAAPIAFTSRMVPPELGRMPISTSGSPNVAARVGDPEVARQRQLEPAAQAPAADRRDRRLRQRGDTVVDAAGVAVVGQRLGRARLLHLAHVGARPRTPARCRRRRPRRPRARARRRAPRRARARARSRARSASRAG